MAETENGNSRGFLDGDWTLELSNDVWFHRDYQCRRHICWKLDLRYRRNDFLENPIGTATIRMIYGIGNSGDCNFGVTFQMLDVGDGDDYV